MQTEATQVNQNVRYEPDERLSPSLTLGLGFQYAALIVGRHRTDSRHHRARSGRE